MQKRKSNEMSTDLNRSLQSGFTPGVKVTHVSLDKRGTFVGSDLNRLLQSGFYCGHKKNPQSIRSRVGFSL